METYFLRKSIISVLVYFDNFDYPLTLLEIYNNLIFLNKNEKCFEKLSIFDLEDFLNKDEKLKKIIRSHFGFYFLFGRENLLQLRKERFKVAVKKYKKLLSWLNFLIKIPFIKLIAVCNTLAYNNARTESDLDLFLVVKKKHLWTVRFIFILFLDFFRLRPQKNNNQDKICLSFIISDEKLDLSSLLLEEQDIYFYYWLLRLVIVYEEDDFYQKFKESNQWIKSILEYSEFLESNDLRKIKTKSVLKLFLEKTLSGIMGGFLERWLKKIQYSKILRDRNNLINNDTRFIVNDDVLKFHGENDRRQEIRENFKNKLNSFLVLLDK